jgi:hypothetical protein
MAKRFVLFSLPRCGSTILMHLLNCHPGIRCCNEPFNRDRGDVVADEPVEDPDTLSARLDRLWENYNGIKHVFIPAGWPFHPRTTLNRHLLLRAGQRIILLHRQNLLQQIVSNDMAVQSQAYETAGADYRRKIEEFQFQPLEESKVASRLRIWRRDIENYHRDLLRRDVPFLEVTYEELFGPSLTIGERRSALGRVYEFLGRDPTAEGIDHLRIDALIDPARSKVNSADTYRLVPGIERIERRFGSRENGWLFQ